MGIRIGVTWLITNGGGDSAMGIMNFNLRRTEVRKMEKNRLIHSVIYSDLTQAAQRIYNASLPL